MLRALFLILAGWWLHASGSLEPTPDPRVFQYISSPWGFSTSTFFISGPEGLVMVDTQFLPSACREAVDLAEQTTGKKVRLAVVLHPNPDKFNGTGWLRRRGVPVITSEAVRKLIPGVHKLRVAWFFDRYQPDYPRRLTLPESFGSATKGLQAAGLKLKLHVLGPGCSEAHVVVEWEGNLFTGDLVANGAHSWLEIGRTDAWLQRLEELAALHPKAVHPGRGPSGGPELLEKETTYLRKVMALVAEEKPNGEPSDEVTERIKGKVMAAYPGYTFDYFLTLGLPAEWRRQAKETAGERGP